MAVQFIDLLKEQELELGHSKKVLFGSEHFHTWIHGDWPGTKGPMHKHTADQFFCCLQGECTFHFPDGSRQAIGPGQMMLIPKEHLYQLDNTGSEYLILLGARAEAAARPRFGSRDELVGDNNFVFEHPDKVQIPKNRRPETP